MANKLSIEAELNADGVSKGIDDIDNQLQSLEKTAADTSEKAAASTEKWTKALDDLGKAAPSGELDKTAQATTAAGNAAEGAQGAFAKLGSMLSNLGSTVGGKLKAGFSGLAGSLGSVGRIAGAAFRLAFLAGISVVAIGAAIAYGLYKALTGIYAIADAAGKEWMRRFTAAFSAGMNLNTLNQIKAQFSNVFADTKDQEAMALSIGKVMEQLRAGGKEADVLKAIFKGLGADVKQFGAEGEGFAAQFAKMIPVLQQMDKLQQSRVLEKMFPEATKEQLAQLILNLDKMKESAENAQKTMSAITVGAGINQAEKAMGDAAANFRAGLNELLAAFNEVTGAADIWRNSMAQIPNILNMAAIAFRGLAVGIRALPGILKEFGAAIGEIPGKLTALAEAFAKLAIDKLSQLGKILMDIANAFAALAAIAWGGITAGINAIGEAFNNVVQWAKPALDALQSVIDLAKQAANLAGSVFGGGGSTSGGGTGGGGGFRMVPVQPENFGPQFRAAFVPPVVNGLVGPQARAANNNEPKIGGYTSAQWDTLLLNTKEWTKEQKKAADAATKLATASKSQADALTVNNSALAQMLQTLGISAADLQEWVNSTALAKTATEEWADAQLRLKAALEAGMITQAQYASSFARLKAEMDTGPMQTAINDLQSGMESFGETAASSLADAIVNGEDLGEVFKNLAKQLASMLLQTLLFKPLFGALGSVFPGVSGFSAVAGGGVPAYAANPNLRALSANPYAGLSNFAGRAANDAGGVGGGQTVTQYNKTDIKVDTGTGESKVTASQGVAFARQLDAAVQQILVREQRPGGTLYRRAG
jgi:hypothetical protein